MLQDCIYFFTVEMSMNRVLYKKHGIRNVGLNSYEHIEEDQCGLVKIKGFGLCLI